MEFVVNLKFVYQDASPGSEVPIFNIKDRVRGPDVSYVVSSSRRFKSGDTCRFTMVFVRSVGLLSAESSLQKKSNLKIPSHLKNFKTKVCFRAF